MWIFVRGTGLGLFYSGQPNKGRFLDVDNAGYVCCSNFRFATPAVRVKGRGRKQAARLLAGKYALVATAAAAATLVAVIIIVVVAVAIVVFAKL